MARRREKFEELVVHRLDEVGMNRTELSRRLGHGRSGVGDRGNKIGKWFRGGSAPPPEEVRNLARELNLHPIELFVSLGWLDDDVLPVALRSGDTHRSLAEGLRAFEATLEFLPISGGAIADAAAKTGKWEVTLIPKHHTVSVMTDAGESEVRLHLDDIVGLAPANENHGRDDVRNAVLTDFAAILRRTGGMPEDDETKKERYSSEYAPRSDQTLCWLRVPRLMAERAPHLNAISLDPIRSIAIIGGHWGGQDDVAAMLASALGWGYINTSFAAMNLFGRDLSNAANGRSGAQAFHNSNAALVARTLDATTELSDQRVWAHGSPGSIEEVARILGKSRKKGQFVIYFKPSPECNRLAEEATTNPPRPDSVKADEADRAGNEASKLLSGRVADGTAKEIPVSADVFSHDAGGFNYFIEQLRAVRALQKISDAWRSAEPRDPAVRALLEANSIG